MATPTPPADAGSFPAWLGRLRFVTRQRRHGGTWGERRSTRRGTGLEFADYRDYTPGDDPRRVDWNLYARLDRPYVRLYEEEEELHVVLLLDGSASMAWGSGAGARWPLVTRLASTLGSIALLSGDRLTGALLRAGKATHIWGPGRGRVRHATWQQWVRGLEPQGEAHMAAALRDYAARASRPGLVVLLSDGYDPEGLDAGITALAAQGHEIALLHPLTPEERAPDFYGDLQLVDVESAQQREVTLDEAALLAYQERLVAWQRGLHQAVARHGGRYVMLPTEQPLQRLLLEELRRAHILR